PAAVRVDLDVDARNVRRVRLVERRTEQGIDAVPGDHRLDVDHRYDVRNVRIGQRRIAQQRLQVDVCRRAGGGRQLLRVQSPDDQVDVHARVGGVEAQRLAGGTRRLAVHAGVGRADARPRDEVQDVRPDQAAVRAAERAAR